MTSIPLTALGPGRRHHVRVALAVLAGALVLSGCSGAGTIGANGSTTTVSATASGTSSGDSGVDCDLNGCTVTLRRGVDADASVLGVQLRLTGVTGDKATLQIGGQQVTVPLNGQGSASAGGLTVTAQSSTADTIVLRVTRG